MFGEEKNLKDISAGSFGITLKDTHLSISYTKTQKLITALYMVTDIIDKDEPLRNKLRTLGTGIISDMNSVPSNSCSKISEIMSFLDIASAMNIISEMNTNILRKEFVELDQSILSAQAGKASTDRAEVINKHINLSEFFNSPLEEYPLGGGGQMHPPRLRHPSRGESKGHTRIGVQKGSTLLKAIKDMSNNMPAPYEAGGFRSGSDIDSMSYNFEIIKKQRRDEIKDSIKANNGNATIKDIKDKAQGSLLNCGEKTLQRELISMVKDGVLNKTGEKRWSRYFLK